MSNQGQVAEFSGSNQTIRQPDSTVQMPNDQEGQDQEAITITAERAVPTDMSNQGGSYRENPQPEPTNKTPNGQEGHDSNDATAGHNLSLRETDEFNKHRKLLIYFAKDLSTEWKKVGRNLLLGGNDLKLVDGNNKDAMEKAYQMLLKWIQSSKKEPTMEVLRQALLAAGRKDLFDEEGFTVAARTDGVDVILTDDQLSYIAERLPTDWKFVGRLLQLEEHRLREIEQDNPNKVGEQAHEMLTVWKQNLGQANSSVLKEALVFLGRNKLAGWMKNKTTT